MTQALPEYRAWRRAFLAGMLGFSLSFVVAAAAGPYLVLRFVLPEQGWASAALPLLMSLKKAKRDRSNNEILAQ
jgi:hypothetical protein